MKSRADQLGLEIKSLSDHAQQGDVGRARFGFLTSYAPRRQQTSEIQQF